MSQIVMESMQWSALTHIDDVEPIGDRDAECLEEIRLVLAKHDCLGRFGIALLHSHFDLQDGEMMLETTNVERREHWVRPVRRSFLEENGMTAQTTIVGFDENGYVQRCGCLPQEGRHDHPKEPDWVPTSP